MPDGLPGYDTWLTHDPNDEPVPWASCTVTLSVQVSMDCPLDTETMQPIVPDYCDWLSAIPTNHWSYETAVVKAEVTGDTWYE